MRTLSKLRGAFSYGPVEGPPQNENEVVRSSTDWTSEGCEEWHQQPSSSAPSEALGNWRGAIDDLDAVTDEPAIGMCSKTSEKRRWSKTSQQSTRPASKSSDRREPSKGSTRRSCSKDAECVQRVYRAALRNGRARAIQRAWRTYRMRMSEGPEGSDSVSSGLGADELAHWNSQTLRFLYYTNSVVKDPDMYLGMIGELFGLISLICFVITWKVHPEVFEDNPLFAALGYNNICVAFDTSPARQLAAIAWAMIIYCTVEYCRIVVSRINTTLRQCPSWKLQVMKICHSVYAGTSAVFLLCFLFPPTKSRTWHTRPFAAYMIFKYLSTLCFVWEARLGGHHHSLEKITGGTWVFMAVYGSLSLSLPVCVELSYAHYDADPTLGPLLSPYVFGMLDWSWFVCTCLYANFLPKPALLVRQRAIHRETLERQRMFFGHRAPAPWCDRLSRCRLSCCRRRSSKIADLDMSTTEREHIATMGSSHIAELADVFAAMTSEHTARDPASPDPRYGWTITVMRATLTIDERVEELEPWHRCGLLERPGSYRGFVRVNVTEHGAARLSIRLDVPDTMEVLDECDAADGRPGVRQVDLLLAEGLEQFATPTPHALLQLLEFVRNPGLRDLLRVRTLWRAIRGFLMGLRGLDNTTGVEGKTFYSGLPCKLGSGACKFAMTPKMDHRLSGKEVPCGTPGATMTGKEMEVTQKYAAAMMSQLHNACEAMQWDFRVQVAKCERSHNLAEGDSVWSAAASPYIAVGSFHVHPEPGHAGGVLDQEGPPLYFNPWNMLKAHEPLGALNLARRSVYREHQKVRRRAGGCKQADLVCPYLVCMDQSFA